MFDHARAANAIQPEIALQASAPVLLLILQYAGLGLLFFPSQWPPTEPTD